MISDLIIAAVIIGFIVIGAIRGFARTLLNFAGLVLNLMLSHFLSGVISGWIYTTFIQKVILSNLELEIAKNGFSEAVANSMKSAPDWVNTMLNTFFAPMGVNTGNLQKGIIIDDTQAQQLAKTIEQPMSEIIIAVLNVIVMTVLFFLFMIIIKLIIRAILKFFRLSALSGINHFFGGIFGCIEGIVFVCLAINIFYVIMTYASPALTDNHQYFGTLFRALCVYL